MPLVGYNCARALANRQDLDVTIATHVRNRSSLQCDPLNRMAKIVYPNNEYVAAHAYRAALLFRGNRGKGWTTNTAAAWLSYQFFEHELYRELKFEIDHGQFDLIHRITPVSPTIGGPLVCRTNIPMLLGPLNGGLPWPKPYPELRRQENEFLVPLRKAYRLLPNYRATYERTHGVIAGSRHTSSEIPRYFSGHRYLLPENGVDPDRFELADDWTVPKDRFRFVTVGRLVPYKGLWLTLEAMRDSKTLIDSELHVIGDGPDRQRMETMARDFGIAHRVRFAGWLEQREMARELRESQAFVFPSLREFGGGVVLEAMASGLPSIIVDYGGPAELVDRSSGILLKLEPKAKLVAALREAMESLVDNPYRCRQFALNAVSRVREEFTWSAKAEKISRIYHDILKTHELPCKPRNVRELATLASTS